MEHDHALRPIISSQLGLGHAEAQAQNASVPGQLATVCPICFYAPLEDSGNVRIRFQQPTAAESVGSRQETLPLSSDDMDLDEPSDSSSGLHVNTEYVEACNSGTQAINAMLNHIADQLQFLALLTPRLWSEKLADRNVRVSSSSRAVSSEGVPGKRSTLDDEVGGREETNLDVLHEDIPCDMESTRGSLDIIPDSASDGWSDVPGHEIPEEDKLLQELIMSGAFQSHAVKANDKPFPIDVCSDLPPPFPYPHLLMRDKNKERGGVKLPAAAY